MDKEEKEGKEEAKEIAEQAKEKAKGVVVEDEQDNKHINIRTIKKKCKIKIVQSIDHKQQPFFIALLGL